MTDAHARIKAIVERCAESRDDDAAFRQEIIELGVMVWNLWHEVEAGLKAGEWAKKRRVKIGG